MTQLIVGTQNNWTETKLKVMINLEEKILKKAISKSWDKLQNFEDNYGEFDRETMYGKVDDMELIEWEGEIETIEKLEEKLNSFEEIRFEHR